VRLNKYIVELGICSRRKADDLIASGNVSVNGKEAQLGYQLNDGDLLEIDSKEYKFCSELKQKFYIALYKPKSFVTSFEDDSKNLNELLIKENFIGTNEEYEQVKDLQLHYAGRLDKESSGLLLLTNDGDCSYKLTHPKYGSEKEYLVEVKKELDTKAIKQLQEGVEIKPEDNGESVITNPCFVEKIDTRILRIILTQGFKRQIRLMLKAVNNEVLELKRIRIGNIALKEYKIFFKQLKNNPYTNMIILDQLNEYQCCLIDKPSI
jgi:pseudouridine synthase